MIPKFFNGSIVQEVGKIEFFSTYCVVTDRYFDNIYPIPYEWLFWSDDYVKEFKKNLINTKE